MKMLTKRSHKRDKDFKGFDFTFLIHDQENLVSTHAQGKETVPSCELPLFWKRIVETNENFRRVGKFIGLKTFKTKTLKSPKKSIISKS